MTVKPMQRRFGTHYESLPHDNCIDPTHCDCECDGCMREWVRAGRPNQPPPSVPPYANPNTVMMRCPRCRSTGPFSKVSETGASRYRFTSSNDVPQSDYRCERCDHVFPVAVAFEEQLDWQQVKPHRSKQPSRCGKVSFAVWDRGGSVQVQLLHADRVVSQITMTALRYRHLITRWGDDLNSMGIHLFATEDSTTPTYEEE